MPKSDIHAFNFPTGREQVNNSSVVGMVQAWVAQKLVNVTFY
jgi:hypothetical protein